jgi:phosphotriesterase-related protein
MSARWPAGQVMTVVGLIPAESLGLTSMHEHVLCDVSSYRVVEADVIALRDGLDLPFDLKHRRFLTDEGFFLSTENCLLDDAAIMTAELTELNESGGATVLELSCSGLRTDVGGVAKIAAAAGVTVVVSTGLYIEPSWPAELANLDEAALESFMVGEIEDGIGTTGIRAGHIGEIGVTDLGPGQARVLRAAARAALRTGLAVTIHPGWEPKSDGRAILPLMKAEGLRADRVILAHADAFLIEHSRRRLILEPESRQSRLDYHLELLEAGANLSFDCFGHDWNIGANDWVIESDIDRLTGVIQLVEAGYAAQIVLGTDTCFKMLTRRGGGLGYRHLPDKILPLLTSLGVQEKDIDAMTKHAPARLLGRVET